MLPLPLPWIVIPPVRPWYRLHCSIVTPCYVGVTVWKRRLLFGDNVWGLSFLCHDSRYAFQPPGAFLWARFQGGRGSVKEPCRCRCLVSLRRFFVADERVGSSTGRTLKGNLLSGWRLKGVGMGGEEDRLGGVDEGGLLQLPWIQGPPL